MIITAWISLYTIIRREWTRLLRAYSQMFITPVITISLYFLIFSNMIFKRIGLMQGLPYPLFVTPGFVMMQVILTSYGGVSFSFFFTRFQRSIEEILISPTPNGFILLGFVMGGLMRSSIVALLVIAISSFFVPLELAHPGIIVTMIILVAGLFANAGFLNAMIARNFDDMMLIPTFVLTPLTSLGGVFYSIDILPPFWRMLSQANPIVYMVNGFRYGMLGQSDISVYKAIGMTAALLFALVIINLHMLKKGVGLKS